MFEKSVPVKQSLGGPQLLSIGIYVRFNKRTTARILRMGPMQSFWPVLFWPLRRSCSGSSGCLLPLKRGAGPSASGSDTVTFSWRTHTHTMAPALRSRSDNVKVIMPVKAKVAKRIVKKVKQTFVAKDDDVDRESFFSYLRSSIPWTHTVIFLQLSKSFHWLLRSVPSILILRQTGW